MGDGRDERTWVVFELTSSGDKAASAGLLEAHLRLQFKSDLEVFIPYISFTYGGRTTLFNVMEGYAFVESGYPERAYLEFAAESPFLKQVLHTTGSSFFPALMTVPHRKVLQLQDQLGNMIAVEIETGMDVVVRQGICTGLAGRVLGVDDNNAQVLFTMRTLKTIRSIPRQALLPKEIDDE